MLEAAATLYLAGGLTPSGALRQDPLRLAAIARIANVDAGDIDRADPHGLGVRLK